MSEGCGGARPVIGGRLVSRLVYASPVSFGPFPPRTHKRKQSASTSAALVGCALPEAQARTYSYTYLALPWPPPPSIHALSRKHHLATRPLCRLVLPHVPLSPPADPRLLPLPAPDSPQLHGPLTLRLAENTSGPAHLRRRRSCCCCCCTAAVRVASPIDSTIDNVGLHEYQKQ